jgi:NRPS condensation-like uncharacterized protein
VEWIRLDNASKIFPATCNDRDTKVFRLACELVEAVEPEILQKALDATIERFPLYKSVLRRGIFWYYLETSDIHPVVEKEDYPVCAPIYRKDKRNLLFRTFYYNNRINLEVFHALSDGTGALWFMKTLVFHYLLIKYKDEFTGELPKLNYNASISEKMDDSFIRYYPGKDFHKTTVKDYKKETPAKAYHIRGTRLDENRVKVIEGAMSVKAVLEEAHKYNTTLTIFLASLLICSIYQEMPLRRKSYPVVLSVPINLRQFFKSETARNFFCTMNIAYRFEESSADLKDVIRSVSESFRTELTEERLYQQLNWFISLERNPFARVVPLPFKNYSLRIANKVSDMGVTSSISNVGQISMPSEFDGYIRQFIIIPNIKKPKMAICTFGDRLVVSFASPFQETEIQKTFFESLSKMGVEIEISSNI